MSLPLDIIYYIFEFLPLTTFASIKTTSKRTNKNFNQKLKKTYEKFHNKLFTNKPTKQILFTSKLPQRFSPTTHMIYEILKRFERADLYIILLSPTSLHHHHLITRHTTFSGQIPILKIPTAMECIQNFRLLKVPFFRFFNVSKTESVMTM